MPFAIIDPAQFLPSEMFRQEDFLNGVSEFDWNQMADAKVLVRGCGDVLTPPWAYMTIAAQLVGIAKSVRYGNEHDNVVIYRRKGK